MSQRATEIVERPTVFLPVEVKLREFRAKLLLASVAAREGFRAYLGTKSTIEAAIAARPYRAGIYVAKGGDRLEVALHAKAHCERLVVLDEELGPALSPDGVRRMWLDRSSPALEEHFDRILMLSAAHQEVLHGIRPSLRTKTVVTGWPRVDLWSPEFRSPDEGRAAELRDQYGPFVLFVSNFKVSSEMQRRHRIDTARTERGRLAEPARGDRSADNDYGTFATARFEGFQRAVHVLRQLAGDLREPRLVVRPHPAEDPDDWRQALDGVPGVTVAFEGEAGPWLLASQALLHTGCTTAVEATVYGVPCGYLAHVGYLTGSFEDTTACRVSRRLEAIGDVHAFLREIENTDGRRRAVYELSEHDLGPRDGRAVDRVVAVLAELEATSEPPLPTQRAAELQRWLRERYRRAKRLVPRPGRRRFYGTNAQPKVPGGLPKAEASNLLRELGHAKGILVTEAAPNLLCIETTDGPASQEQAWPG